MKAWNCIALALLAAVTAVGQPLAPDAAGASPNTSVLLSSPALTRVPDGTPVDVRVTLDPSVIPFHHQATLSVVVEAPNDVNVNLPELSDRLGGLLVADVNRKTESLRKDRKRITESYTVEAVFAGDYAVPPIQVTWGDDAGIEVPVPALKVRDLTPEEKAEAEKFEPIAGPYTPPGFFERNWHWFALGGTAVLMLLGAGLYAWTLRKRIERAAPPIPPWEIAYGRLRGLDEKHLPDAGEYEPYYVELSAILRYYIEDRFHLHAPEQTTPEFLAAASGSGALEQEHQRILADFLRHCDRVKFAQYVPNVSEMERSFATVLQFVDQTVPKPKPESAKEAA